MSRYRSLSSLLLACLSGLALGGVGIPADAAPVAPAAAAPTHPRSLVNDPGADTTPQDTTQNSVSIAVAGPNIVAAYNDTVSRRQRRQSVRVRLFAVGRRR